MEAAEHGGSWRVDEGCPRALLLALYLRDASGLAVDMTRPVPPLEPPIALDRELAVLATARAAADWPGWWEHELARGADPAAAEPDQWFGRSLAGRELRALLVMAAPRAYAWTLLRDREHQDLFVEQIYARGPLAGDVVGEVEGELGRAARPFALHIDVLPVQGRWGVRFRSDHVVVSRDLRRDPVAFPTFLEPVVQRLA